MSVKAVRCVVPLALDVGPSSITLTPPGCIRDKTSPQSGRANCASDLDRRRGYDRGPNGLKDGEQSSCRCTVEYGLGQRRETH